MADAIIKFFQELLNNDILTIFIISMIPIVELRGAVPVAIEMGFSWYEAFGYAFLGSIIVAPILLLILMPILNAMKKIKFFRGLANAVENLFQSKAESVRKKANKADSKNTEDIIKMVGVFLFVAIPLPLTGVWTGTAVAVFLGLGFWKSMISVAVGNVSAGLIMTGLSLLFKDNLNLFLTIFMAVVLGVLVLNIIYLVVKSHLKKKKAVNESDCKDGENKSCNIANDNVEICEDMNEKNENNTQRLQNAIVSDTESVVGNILEKKIENNDIAGLNDKFESQNVKVSKCVVKNIDNAEPQMEIMDNDCEDEIDSGKKNDLKVDFSNIHD